jgi:hypothetical protein
MRLEWETAHKVTEELVEGPPSRRANATFIPCPSGNYLWCIGGEFFSEDKKAVSLFFLSVTDLYVLYANEIFLQYFYNDVFRYSPDKVHPQSCHMDPCTHIHHRMNGESSLAQRAQDLVRPMLPLQLHLEEGRSLFSVSRIKYLH